jgi:hypothetical protein
MQLRDDQRSSSLLPKRGQWYDQIRDLPDQLLERHQIDQRS